MKKVQVTKTKKQTGPILGREAKVLREIASPVPVKEISSTKIKSILSMMKKALHKEEDGVAIAAPQIGESLRIFVVSSKALDLAKPEKKALGKAPQTDLIFINPEVIKTSKKRKRMEEGCLSVRWLYGEVDRYEKITIQAYDEKGEKSEFGASGLIAQIFQHEIDHLNGILFIDKAENVRDLPPNKDEQ